ncbi:Dimer-Tnp-hAT domain containing protein [Pyrenophora tritici-repentis]|nr:Dimer-Tnp-hAT domain containing protein [Pyrenophora tritici-repentis]
MAIDQLKKGAEVMMLSAELMRDRISSLEKANSAASERLTENEEDEYEAWKRSEPIAGEGVDPIKYWVELRDRHPSLSKFAIDMLSIPGSSCECERLFSELGDLLEPRRRSISPQLLAAIQCDRRWIRAGFGSGEVPVKEAISDEEMDAKYGVHKWDIS